MSLQGFYTTKGLALAAKLSAGTKLTVTKVAAGSGATAVSASVLTNARQMLTVGSAKVAGQTATLPVTLAESGATASYTLTELGVYATDPDEGEILFQVFGLSKVEEILAGGEDVYRFYLKVTVGASGVTVNCSPAGLLIEEDLGPAYAAVAKKPDAVRAYTILHVAKIGNDTTGDGSESKPFLTIQKAVNSLPKLLMEDTVIKVHAGSYDEIVGIIGFSGSNPLQICANGDESVQIKAIFAWKVSCSIELYNFELTGVNPTQFNSSIHAGHVSEIIIQNVNCVQAVTSADYGAFTFHLSPNVKITSCKISNKPIALDVMASTVYLNDLCIGTNNTVGIRCGSGWGRAGGFVQKGGASIAGEEQKGYGGQIW